MKLYEEIIDLLKEVKGIFIPDAPKINIPQQVNSPIKKFIFRPRTIDEYIGQEKAKALIKLNLRKIADLKPIHMLINGNAGHGKTTLAYVVANELRAKLHSVIGSSFSMDYLIKFLTINEEDCRKLHILFIDEIHSMDKTMVEFMYPILEDFQVNDAYIKPFVMIGATTEKATLVKKFNPLVQRCGCQIHLDHYTGEEIEKMLKQYSQQLYEVHCVPEKVLKILSLSCKYVPRVGISMLDDYIVCKDMDAVLSAHRIVTGSLSEVDILILMTLRENVKPMGQKNIAVKVGIEQTDYIYVHEPFLLREGYINVSTRGREITRTGIKLLKEIGV